MVRKIKCKLHIKQGISLFCVSMLTVMGTLCSLPSQYPASAEETDTTGILGNPQADTDGITTWDCIYFGHYWQNDTNRDGTADQNDEKEPIKWRVLSIDGNHAFLLADCNLDCQPYHTSNTPVTWEDSSLRRWLNGSDDDSNDSDTDDSGNISDIEDNDNVSDIEENSNAFDIEDNDNISDIEDSDNDIENNSNSFINAAFTQKEQSAIYSTQVVNDDNPDFGTAGGNDTTDKVYLLSIAEACAEPYGFHADYNSRVANNTAYAKKQDGSSNTSESGDWLLRSPGNVSHSAAYVTDDGYIFKNGCRVDNNHIAVRPALHLDLTDTDLWAYAGQITIGAEGTEEPSEPPEQNNEPSSAPDNATPSTKPSATPDDTNTDTKPSTSPDDATPDTEPSTTPDDATPDTEPSTSPDDATPDTEPSTTPDDATPDTEPSASPDNATPDTEPSTSPGYATPDTEPSASPDNVNPAGTATELPADITPAPSPDAAAQTTITKEEKEKNSYQMNKKISLSQTDNILAVSWNPLPDAQGYDIYAAFCGSDFGEITMSLEGQENSKAQIKKVNGKSISKTKTYKVKVRAYQLVDGQKQYIGTSAHMHVAGSQHKNRTNAKSIKVTKASYTLKKGISQVLNASIQKQDKKKKLLPKKHGARLQYASSDQTIATVTKNGKIKAKGKGNCVIYIRALNGISKSVKVTVS